MKTISAQNLAELKWMFANGIDWYLLLQYKLCHRIFYYTSFNQWETGHAIKVKLQVLDVMGLKVMALCKGCRNEMTISWPLRRTQIITNSSAPTNVWIAQLVHPIKTFPKCLSHSERPSSPYSEHPISQIIVSLGHGVLSVFPFASWTVPTRGYVKRVPYMMT